MIERLTSFLEYYLNFFGDKKSQFIGLIPDWGEGGRVHLSLMDEGDAPLPPPVQGEVEDFDNYVHPCWCNPELIYADDLRGNEVWLHKPVQ